MEGAGSGRGSGYGGSGTGDSGLSQHPVDRLIRELIQTGRDATPDEITEIRERASHADFNTERVRVAKRYRHISYQGRTVGNREDALFLHLVERVKHDQEWVEGTTMDEYLDDIRRSALEGTAIVVYMRHEEFIAAIAGPNRIPDDRRGPNQ